MRGINCKALWIKALYKCSPFTIYQQCLPIGSLQILLLACKWQAKGCAILL
uniref:Uncharacterized protein n=1 Tax=Anguilla anguilla TaxID=7936 RepID=A0A0E9QEQ1_ANGAN